MKRTRLRQLLLGLIVAIGLPSSAQEVFEVPYVHAFNTSDCLDGWTVINGNNDYSSSGTAMTWRYSIYSKCLEIGYSAEQDDDWVITPAVHLEAGKTYAITTNLENMFSWSDTNHNQIEIRLCLNNTPEGLNILAQEAYKPDGKGPLGRDYHDTTYVEAPATGNYFIAVHSVSYPEEGGHTSYMEFYDMRIDYVATENTPDSVTNVSTTPASNGDLKATVKFTAPTKNIDGTALTSITKINVLANDNLIKTIENPSPGEEITFETSEGWIHGINRLQIVAFNANGEGLSNETNPFVGVDMPGNVKNLHVEDHLTSITLAWDPVPEVGYNGYYVNPDRVWYYVYDSNGALLGKTDNRYFNITLTTNTGTQRSTNWRVVAENDGGTGYSTYIYFTLGKPYSLPVEEHYQYGNAAMFYRFGGRTGSSMLDVIANGDDYGITTPDGDNAMRLFTTPWYGNTTAYMELGKVSMKNSHHPRVSYSYYLQPTYYATMSVIGVDPNGAIDTLKVNNFIDVYYQIPGNDMWVCDTLNLDRYADKEYVSIRFFYSLYDPYSKTQLQTFLDDIRFYDIRENDLTISLSTPDEVEKGRTLGVNATVTNVGSKPSEPVRVNLYADGELVESKRIPINLKPENGTQTVPFSLLVPTTNENDEIEIKVEVANSSDEIPENNTATNTVYLYYSDQTSPTALTAVETSNGVELDWTAVPKQSEELTDGFEDYAPWGEDFGHWLTIDRDQSLSDLGPFWITPEYFAPRSFVCYSPDAEMLYYLGSFAANQGAQYAVAQFGWQPEPWYTEETLLYQTSDDWLISELLSGDEQEISFYAHTFNYPDPEEYWRVYYYEDMQLMYSTTDREPESFISVCDTTITTFLWTNYKFKVPAGAKYFAIHHNTKFHGEEVLPGRYTSYILGIDDVTYTADNSARGYYIYRDGELIATVGPDGDTHYVDETPGETGEHTYKVSAFYRNGGESEPVVATITTAINEIKLVDETEAPVFDIMGRRVTGQLRTGIYVKNGKKFVVK